MFGFRRSQRAPEKRSIPKGSEPSLTLLPASEVEPGNRYLPLRGDEHSFHAGIRALYGQLCSCQSRTEEPIRSVGITSCNPGEGKSTVAAELARIAAECEHTLLVSANDARFSVQRALQDMARPSLMLTDSAEPESPRNISIDVVHGENGASAATVRSIRELLESLTAKFDLVIVDLPAVSSPGCLEWAAALDGLLFVIRSEHVRWQVAARGLTVLEQAGGHVLGSVINKRRDHIPEFLYSRL